VASSAACVASEQGTSTTAFRLPQRMMPNIPLAAASTVVTLACDLRRGWCGGPRRGQPPSEGRQDARHEGSKGAPHSGCALRVDTKQMAIKSVIGGYLGAMARTRSVAGYAIPGIVLLFLWLVLIILAIILLAFIVHWAGGGLLNLRLGHFILNVGFT
jgi:hypothetical protein